MQVDDERMGPGQLSYIASIVADGTATPAEATSLLREFVRQVDEGNVSDRLLEHMRDCVAAFLAGKKRIHPAREAGRTEAVSIPIKTMDKAFGLTRISTGQPRIDSEALAEVAAAVLELRLTGEPHLEAVASVASERRDGRLAVASETEVGKAWSTHRQQGLWLLRAMRVLRNEAWSPEEMQRLTHIFEGIPGVVLPGERPFEGRHALPEDRDDRAGPENPNNKPP